MPHVVDSRVYLSHGLNIHGSISSYTCCIINAIYIQGWVFDQNGIFKGKGSYVQSVHPHPIIRGSTPPQDSGLLPLAPFYSGLVCLTVMPTVKLLSNCGYDCTAVARNSLWTLHRMIEEAPNI